MTLNMFSDPEIVEILAERLHDAWMQEKLSQGWTYGPVRDNQKKTHPSLVPYEDLPESEKELDRMFIRELPRVLAYGGIEDIRDLQGTPEDIERLAKGVHNLWLEKRKAQGWTKETDPQMVEYEELPESSKQMNRKTATTILSLIEEANRIMESKKVESEQRKKTGCRRR